MATLREAADAIINRAESASAGATAEDLIYLAKATEAVGVTSVVGFINATSEMQNARVLTTGDEQNARVIATGDAEVARVVQTMGDAVGVLTTKGDLLVHDGAGAARVPVGAEGQGLLAGADGLPQWSDIVTKVVNVAHYSWSTISRVTWGNSYGNIFSGSDWTYRPLRNDSKILVLSELWASTNQNYAGAWTMWLPVDASGNALSGQSWRYGPGGEGEVYNPANPASPSTFNPYNGSSSQFGDLYQADGNTSRKFASSLLFSPSRISGFDVALGHRIRLATTGFSWNSNWLCINESYGQGGYAQRYGYSSYTLFELAP